MLATASSSTGFRARPPKLRRSTISSGKRGRHVTAALLIDVPDSEVVKSASQAVGCASSPATTTTSTSIHPRPTASAIRTDRVSSSACIDDLFYVVAPPARHLPREDGPPDRLLRHSGPDAPDRRHAQPDRSPRPDPRSDRDAPPRGRRLGAKAGQGP